MLTSNSASSGGFWIRGILYFSAGEATTLFDVNMMQKDLKLALEMGQDLNVPLPTTALSNEWLTAARGMGLSDQDHVAVFQVLARLSGLEP